MRGSGRRTSKTDMGRRHGLMKQSIRETTSRERSMGRENSCGKTIAAMRDSFLTIISMDRESMSGTMAELMRVSGRTIKWRGKGSLHGLTAGYMRDITKMIRNKALASSPSEMGEFTRVNGKMASSTEEACLERRMFKDRGSGSKGSE